MPLSLSILASVISGIVLAALLGIWRILHSFVKEQREQNLLREELDALPDRIATLEAEQKDLEAKLADPELYSRDPAGFEAVTKRMAEVEQEQLEALERWEAVEARLQELADIVKKD